MHTLIICKTVSFSRKDTRQREGLVDGVPGEIHAFKGHTTLSGKKRYDVGLYDYVSRSRSGDLASPECHCTYIHADNKPNEATFKAKNLRGEATYPASTKNVLEA